MPFFDKKWILSAGFIGLLAIPGMSQSNRNAAVVSKDTVPDSYVSALAFRNIGPAVTSGRISDLAVHPENPNIYYIAAAAGGVWKTTNHGTTFEPIFDAQGSYSIGCVKIDPANPNTVWVGTGENNAQRSIAYGDGIYKSVDGGKTWSHMGLKNSNHIGSIVIDPRNSDHIYVAAHGPLWSEGGERGIYESFDGGKTWKNILEISKHTGVNEIHMDPSNPDVMYASAWQRRRHVFTLISGGPESAIYKTTNGGKTWEKLTNGLPKGDMGRAGLAISPVNPQVVYAIIEATGKESGFYRSTNGGLHWSKQSDYHSSGNYYQEIYCDLNNVDKVFSMNTYAMYTTDGGKSFKPLGENDKHVDNHAMWIDPKDGNHFLIGCDGGLYETYDHAKTFQFKENLPITQFYKVATDQAMPFYNVYGGTQDNFSLGGPSRTTNAAGIVNSDWFITNGGDGFESQVDPKDPNIVYAQAQYGWLVRYDKKSGEITNIQPQSEKGEALRWNWDAPLLISPHSSDRLYFAANRLFRSDDRGNTWKVISPDLSRQINRDELKVMDQIWGVDAVAKGGSTTFYGNITAIAESSLQENLLIVGTDDGLVQISENAGSSWKKIDKFPGVPERTYVNMIVASKHDANTFYVVFNNHKNGDFKPYILKTTDKGATFKAVQTNLPERGSTYCLAEDHVQKDLLFVGTEFGVFVTLDGGKKWVPFSNGLPTIAVRDMEIQTRENDLVLATFGRGFYVLDDYSPLREMKAENLKSEAFIFPIKDAYTFVESYPLGIRGKGFQGSSYYSAENPKVGIRFTYFLKEGFTSLKDKRKKEEEEAKKANKAVKIPSFEALTAEDNEVKPLILAHIENAKGERIRSITLEKAEGVQTFYWDMHANYSGVVMMEEQDLSDPFSSAMVGRLMPAGAYTVQLMEYYNGAEKALTEKVSFSLKNLNNTSMPSKDEAGKEQFIKQMEQFNIVMGGSQEALSESKKKLDMLQKSIETSPTVSKTHIAKVQELKAKVLSLETALYGNGSAAKRNYPVEPGISSRFDFVYWTLANSTSDPTQTQKDQFEMVKSLFEPVYQDLQKLVEQDLPALEKNVVQEGGNAIPGTLPKWKK